MNPLFSTVVTILGTTLLLGCGAANGAAPGQDACDLAREIRPSSSFLSVAEEADIVARVIPGGFGGLFQDFGSTNNLVIYLQDLSKRDSAEATLRRVLSCGAAFPGWLNNLIKTDAIQDRQGQYTASQLLGYVRTLASLRSDADVWGLEVDPEVNRVWIGLTTGVALDRIRQVVTNAGVPSAAVNIEVPPPVTGTEPFTVLENVITPIAHSTDNGVFLAGAHLRYTNRYSETRYPDHCVATDGYTSFLYRIEKWDGQRWLKIHEPVCRLIAVVPTPVVPGGSQTDSVPFVGVRRFNAAQLWQTARITGVYRFVGSVYLSTIPNPPFLTNPAPEEQNSTPFRIVHTLLF